MLAPAFWLLHFFSCTRSCSTRSLYCGTPLAEVETLPREMDASTDHILGETRAIALIRTRVDPVLLAQ